MRSLPELKMREQRSASHIRYGASLSEGLLMASRDGVHFGRWNEAFLRPGIERTGTWQYGHQFIAEHVVETKSALPGAPNELSIYAAEDYWHGKGGSLRRYSLRLDGFTSVHASMKGGDLITRPFSFEGAKLCVNFATSAAGSMRVEVLTAEGQPVQGFTLKESADLFGDSVDRTVTWNQRANVGSLQGKSVRLRFQLKDADLYSFQFQK